MDYVINIALCVLAIFMFVKIASSGSEDTEKGEKSIYDIEREKKAIRQELASQGIYECPRCGSRDSTDGTKGYSLMTGFIGGSSYRHVCRACGHKWKPGE